MALMSNYISRSSIITAWIIMLLAALWIMATAAPVVAVVAMTIISLTAVLTFSALTRRSERTMAKVIRAVDAGGSQ